MGQHINPHLFEGEHLVRQIEKEEEIWFVGADICRVLGLANPHSSLALLDQDERDLHTMEGEAGQREMIIVSEPGVYRLVFKSRKPVAERFKRWLAHEVIPAIRKTGSYGSAQPDAVEPKETQASDSLKLRYVNQCLQVFGHQAAAQLWLQLDLRVVPAMLHDPRQLTIFDYQGIKSVGGEA